MRTAVRNLAPQGKTFLSIQAQDFIEDLPNTDLILAHNKFLSIQAQDFIEEKRGQNVGTESPEFLSIQAQDFIEEIGLDCCRQSCRDS